jgi:hypothetical protein
MLALICSLFAFVTALCCHIVKNSSFGEPTSFLAF